MRRITASCSNYPTTVAGGVRVPHERRAVRQAPLLAPLTAREKEVLDLVASGLSGKEMANELFVEVSTVDLPNSIARKLGVQSRTQAVAGSRSTPRTGFGKVRSKVLTCYSTKEWMCSHPAITYAADRQPDGERGNES